MVPGGPFMMCDSVICIPIQTSLWLRFWGYQSYPSLTLSFFSLSLRIARSKMFLRDEGYMLSNGEKITWKFWRLGFLAKDVGWDIIRSHKCSLRQTEHSLSTMQEEKGDQLSKIPLLLKAVQQPNPNILLPPLLPVSLTSLKTLWVS